MKEDGKIKHGGSREQEGEGRVAPLLGPGLVLDAAWGDATTPCGGVGGSRLGLGTGLGGGPGGTVDSSTEPLSQQQQTNNQTKIGKGKGKIGSRGNSLSNTNKVGNLDSWLSQSNKPSANSEPIKKSLYTSSKTHKTVKPTSLTKKEKGGGEGKEKVPIKASGGREENKKRQPSSEIADRRIKETRQTNQISQPTKGKEGVGEGRGEESRLETSELKGERGEVEMGDQRKRAGSQEREPTSKEIDKITELEKEEDSETNSISARLRSRSQPPTQHKNDT